MPQYKIARLLPGQVVQFRQMNAMFAEVFGDADSYLAKPPRDAYLQGLLQKPHVIALAAFEGEKIVAGLVAYVLEKSEQQRSEVYIYDLAVNEAHRRQGIARALIAELKKIAQAIGRGSSMCRPTKRKKTCRRAVFTNRWASAKTSFITILR